MRYFAATVKVGRRNRREGASFYGLLTIVAHSHPGAEMGEDMRQDGLALVRSDIINRIDALAAQRGHLSLARTCEEVDGIRHVARTYGLEAVEQLASILGSALALDGHGPVVLSYLDLIRDAASCADTGPNVRAAYVASLSLRMGA